MDQEEQERAILTENGSSAKCPNANTTRCASNNNPALKPELGSKLDFSCIERRGEAERGTGADVRAAANVFDGAEGRADGVIYRGVIEAVEDIKPFDG